AVLDALVRLEEVVGRPADDTADELPGLLARPLARATDGLLRVWGGRLTQLAVCLIEQPDFRLAGAEAALHVLRGRVERALAHCGPLGEEWLRKSAQANARIHTLLAGPHSGGGGAEVAEALRLYPRWRYQGLVLRQVVAVYGSLRGQLDDELGEVAL